MKFINKKISIGWSIMSIFIVSAVTYSIGYKFAMDKFNNIISYNHEKQHLYHRLSEIDTAIRREYIGNIDENNLTTGMCIGYLDGLNNSDCKYLTLSEYKNLLNLNTIPSKLEFNIFENSIGYIKIFSITQDFSSSFINTLNSMNSENSISKFVLDLRNLQGGEIENLQNIMDYLLSDSSTISTIPKDTSSKKQLFKTKSKNTDFSSFTFAILVNENTSGIFEILAYCFKNLPQTKFIGTPTAGKIYKNKILNFQSDEYVLVFPFANFAINEVILNEKISVDMNINMDNDKKELLSKNQLDPESDDQLQTALKVFE